MSFLDTIAQKEKFIQKLHEYGYNTKVFLISGKDVSKINNSLHKREAIITIENTETKKVRSYKAGCNCWLSEFENDLQNGLFK
jgi:hypothetical protein